MEPKPNPHPNPYPNPYPYPYPCPYPNPNPNPNPIPNLRGEAPDEERQAQQRRYVAVGPLIEGVAVAARGGHTRHGDDGARRRVEDLVRGRGRGRGRGLGWGFGLGLESGRRPC